MRMCDLATALQLSPSGLTRRLDGLVRPASSSGVASPADRRVMLAALTDRRATQAGGGCAGPRRQRAQPLPRGADRAIRCGRSATSSRPCAANLDGVPAVTGAARRAFSAHVANIGIKDDTDDFVVVAADAPCAAAGVFTRSRFAGPSVVVSREHLADGRARRRSS